MKLAVLMLLLVVHSIWVMLRRQKMKMIPIQRILMVLTTVTKTVLT